MGSFFSSWPSKYNAVKMDNAAMTQWYLQSENRGQSKIPFLINCMKLCQEDTIYMYIPLFLICIPMQTKRHGVYIVYFTGMVSDYITSSKCSILINIFINQSVIIYQMTNP